MRIDNAQLDPALKKWRSQQLQQLLQDERIKEFVREHQLTSTFLDENLTTFLNWQKRLNQCASCSSLQTCQQPVKGKICTLKIDETGFLAETYEGCRYEKEQEKQLEHTRYFVFRHGSREDDLIDLYSISNPNQSKEYLSVYLQVLNSLSSSKGLFLYGQPGTGKTYLLHAASNAIAKMHVQTAFVSVPALMQEMKESMTMNEYRQSVMQRLRTVPVLFLDDIGSEFISRWTRSEILFPLLDERMNRGRKTYFSSNYTMEELTGQYTLPSEPNGRVSALRLIERIRALSTPVGLFGASRR